MTPILPMPEEPMLGQLGRWRAWNRFETTEHCLNAWREDLGFPKRNAGVPIVELAATMSRIAIERYAALHTLMPFIGCAQPEGRSAPSQEQLAKFAAYLPKTSAHFCPACVQEDIGHWKFSFWRRSHQLPGMFWCEKHGQELLSAEAIAPYDRPPLFYLRQGRRAAGARLAEFQSHPEVLHFLETSAAILEAGQLVRTKSFRQRLSRDAIRQGIRLWGTDKSEPLLSDLALQRFPHPYLVALVPAALHKAEGDCLSAIDGALQSQCGSLPVGTAVALSLLYADPADAVSALFSSSDEPSMHGLRKARGRCRSVHVRG
jgi:hypothetical protein